MRIPFEKVAELLEEYKNEHGNLLVPHRYCSVTGVKLGSIVRNIRAGIRKTTVDEKAKLNELGFVWRVRVQRTKKEEIKVAKEKVTVSARIDKDVKEQFERICHSIGLNISDAINVFVRKVVAEEAIPFDVKLKNSKEEK